MQQSRDLRPLAALSAKEPSSDRQSALGDPSDAKSRDPFVAAFFVDRAIQQHRSDPEVVRANIEFLERFLQDSDYSRKKPALMDRFMSQLEGGRLAKVA